MSRPNPSTQIPVEYTPGENPLAIPQRILSGGIKFSSTPAISFSLKPNLLSAPLCLLHDLNRTEMTEHTFAMLLGSTNQQWILRQSILTVACFGWVVSTDSPRLADWQSGQHTAAIYRISKVDELIDSMHLSFSLVLPY